MMLVNATKAVVCGLFVYLVLCIDRPAAAQEAHRCANTIDELRQLTADPAFALRWEETSMLDDKPLVVSMTEREGSLFLGFIKTNEGLWAEGPVSICGSTGELEARITRGLFHVGPAAHWLLRHSLGASANFKLRRLAGGRLRIAAPGWSGEFSPVRN